MKVDRHDIPYVAIGRGRGGKMEYVCPSCDARYLGEVNRGDRKIKCRCGFAWRVDDNGRPAWENNN